MISTLKRSLLPLWFFLLLHPGLRGLSNTNLAAILPADLYSNIILTEPGEIISLMNNYFTNYYTMTTSFKELYLGRYRRGLLTFKKPDKLLVKYFSYGDETSMEIYINSRKLYVYLKKIKIVCEQDLVEEFEETGSEELETEEPELSGHMVLAAVNLDRLLDSYNFNFLESKRPVAVLKRKELTTFRIPIEKKVMAYHFILTPKDKTQSMDMMELWIDQGGVIKRCKATTKEKREIDFLFYETKTSVEVPDEMFEFDIPADAQVVRNTYFGIEFLKESDDEEKEN